MRVSVVPIGAFNQQVQLSCVDGVPVGYACSFSPATLHGGGISMLTIESLANANGARFLSEKASFCGLAIGLVSFFLIGTLGRRSHTMQLLLLLVCCCTISLLGLAGCAAAPATQSVAQKAVLTVRASSGSGPDAIDQSTQIVLVILKAKSD
ncbi:MAG: hypothetical protein ACYDCM_10300 [Candidatus Acidiferrales bacterium]